MAFNVVNTGTNRRDLEPSTVRMEGIVDVAPGSQVNLQPTLDYNTRSCLAVFFASRHRVSSNFHSLASSSAVNALPHSIQRKISSFY